jgi:ParB family chromosome partitioning protein
MDTIAVKDVVVGDRLRNLDSNKVNELMESIQESGLINPIAVDANNKLICGRHRLEAFKLLGIEEIPCKVWDVSEIEAELMEIDENLIRSELHYTERGDHELRRKEIYEELHPETKAAIGAELVNKRWHPDTRAPRAPVLSFVEDTSSKTGISTRVIKEDIQISANLTPEMKEIVREVQLPKKEAIKLASIAKVDPEKAVKVIDLIHTTPSLNVSKATSLIGVVDLKPAESKQMVIDTSAEAELFTIGYGKRSLEEFVKSLVDVHITLLVDIRDSVVSFYKPDFSGDMLNKALKSVGIEYKHIKELGVPYVVRTPYIAGFLDDNAFAKWYEWNITKANVDAFNTVLDDIRTHGKTVLMCAEQYPVPQGDQFHTCHRKYLAEAIKKMGMVSRVTHL